MHKIKKQSIQCLVVTVSDTRTVETDKSGQLISRLLTDNGHAIVNHLIVRDEQKQIEETIKAGLANENVDVILLTGGTGISRRDVTIEAVKSMIDKEINGFGEIFRMLSYSEDIGSAAIISRAIAGVVGRQAIFAMPGSSGAVKLAMNKLILPELAHVIGELHKDLQ